MNFIRLFGTLLRIVDFTEVKCALSDKEVLDDLNYGGLSSSTNGHHSHADQHIDTAALEKINAVIVDVESGVADFYLSPERSVVDNGDELQTH